MSRKNKPGLVSHRGLHGGGIVENTLPAVLNSLEKGFPAELDVRMTRDGALFVFHDKNLLRICGEDRDIELSSAKEIRQARIFGKEYGIPELAQVLEEVKGRQALVLEIKTSGDTDLRMISGKLRELIRDYKGELFLMSFDLELVRLLKEKTKDFPVGLLGGEDYSLKRKFREFITECDFIGYRKDFAGTLWLRFLAKKKPVFLWTFRSRAEAEQSLFSGYCDGAMFEEAI